VKSPFITVRQPFITIGIIDRNIARHMGVLCLNIHNTTSAMKTTISRSLLLLATVFTFGYTNAAEPVRMNARSKKSTLERSLDRALSNNLAYPLLAKGDTERNASTHAKEPRNTGLLAFFTGAVTSGQAARRMDSNKRQRP